MRISSTQADGDDPAGVNLNSASEVVPVAGSQNCLRIVEQAITMQAIWNDTMNRVPTTLVSVGFAAISCAAYAGDMGATALLPADSASAFNVSNAAGESANMSTVAVKGQPFSRTPEGLKRHQDQHIAWDHQDLHLSFFRHDARMADLAAESLQLRSALVQARTAPPSRGGGAIATAVSQYRTDNMGGL
jgi:hypothetical protein